MCFKGIFERVLLTSFSLCIFFSCSCDKNEEIELTPKSGLGFITTSEEFYNWDSITLRNAFSRLDVVPELGGKIMGYEAFGIQMLWHNPLHEGETEIFQQNDIRQEFINAGGAKVWPAPQNKWGGPPDKILDGSPYASSFDGKEISVISPEDFEDDRTGIQYVHKYSLRPSSTLVDLNLSMSNSIDNSIEWALWHLATLPVDGDFTVYVPVDEGDWEVLQGDKDNPQWLGVEDGLFRAQYESLGGKVGMKAREGWAAWHDEANNNVFAMQFQVQDNLEYPHNGHNFEIYTNNPKTPYIELEILGPLTNLNPGDSTSLDVVWGVCRCSDVKRVVPVGVISEEFNFSKEKVVTGKFGVFYSGRLEEYQVDEDGNRTAYLRFMEVSPLNEISLNRKPVLAEKTATIRYQIIGNDGNLIGVIAEAKVM